MFPPEITIFASALVLIVSFLLTPGVSYPEMFPKGEVDLFNIIYLHTIPTFYFRCFDMK